jgi:hypothetical protein
MGKDHRIEGGRERLRSLPDVVLPVGGHGGIRVAGGGHGGQPLGVVAVEELPSWKQHASDGEDDEAVCGQPHEHHGLICFYIHILKISCDFDQCTKRLKWNS